MKSKLPLAGLLALLSGCGPSISGPEDLWGAKGPASYHYTYKTTGFVLPLELLVTVRDRTVSATTVIASTGSGSGAQGRTVEQLFEDVRNRLKQPCQTTVHYDEMLGYPRAVSSYCVTESAGWTVSDLAADFVP